MTDEKAEKMIDTILAEMSREKIIENINAFGADIDWGDQDTRDILLEIWQSDCDVGEEEEGILVCLYNGGLVK